MNKKHFTLAIAILISIASGSAQEVYDLKRCITVGLEKNYSILIARNREKISNSNLTPGNAGMLPSLDASGRYGGTLNTTTQTDFAGNETTSRDIYNTTANAGVTLDWTLFQGFNALTTYKKLNELKQLGILNTQLSIEDFIAGIAAEYYDFIQQLQLFHNLEYAVSLSRERVRIDRERYLLGGASKLQLLQSMVYLNTDSSRFARQKETLKTAQIRINQLISAENIGQNIIPGDSMIQINKGLVFDSLFAATQKSNTSLLIARKNTTISEYDYRIISSRSYPYLNLNSGYNLSRNDYESGANERIETGGFNYGLTLGVNIFDGFNKRRDRSNARIAIENQEYLYKQIEQSVNGDLLAMFYAYQNHLLLLNLEVENLKTANENLEIALERYKLGNLSGLELREVQQSRLEAEERLILVQYQTKIAEISLLQISGGIMSYVN